MHRVPPQTRTRLTRRYLPDTLAVAGLIALWLLFFWRLLTPSAQDAVSLTDGDFSGQFVAFFGYQVERMAEGEIPLWNPYNLGGHPFLADTQSAVFYPPRLLTVWLVSAGGDPSPGELYAALQTEMALHVLLGTLLMYAFVRRLTDSQAGITRPASVTGSMIAALTWGYGGYLTGYPQLQLAILEAGVWLPLVMLAVFQATRGPRPGWLCLVLAGVALGLSLHAGHPQTSAMMIYLAGAWLAYRLWRHTDSWRRFARDLILAGAVIGVVTGGLAAVQLLPGLEYLRLTSRQSMGFDEKGNGFPYYDVAQALYPGFITLFSPLYAGIAGLALAALAAWRRAVYSAFFAIAALIALALSFGAGTVVYDVAFLLVPGGSWFRGQERAAFIVAQSVSVLAGLGAAHALSARFKDAVRRVRWGLVALTGFSVLLAAVLLVLWLSPDGATYQDALRSVSFTALLAALSLALVPRLLRDPAGWRGPLLLVALVVFDLFSITMHTANTDPVPARDRLPEPAMIAQLRDDLLPAGARVDGRRGLMDNYGSLYRLPDVRGISPLKLASVETFLEELPAGRLYDLFAVRYVLTDWEELAVSGTIIASAEDAFGPYNVHALRDPREFAHLVYGVTVVPDDAAAYGLLREPAYDTRQFVILDLDPGVDLPGAPPDDPGSASLDVFEPERIEISAEVAAPAILTLALPHYPGWNVTVNGAEADLLRAYGGLSAVALPAAGAYTVRLDYAPLSYRAGAWISGLTLAGVVMVTASGWVAARRRRERVT